MPRRQRASISHALEPGSLCQECTVSPESTKEITSYSLVSLSQLSRHLSPFSARPPLLKQKKFLSVTGQEGCQPGSRARAGTTLRYQHSVLGNGAAGCPFPRPPRATRPSRDISSCAKSAAARVLNAGSSSPRGPRKVPPAAAADPQ